LEGLGPEQIFVVDYDDMVLHKDEVFPQVYRFIDLAYDPAYTEKLHRKSIDKKNSLSNREIETIHKIADPCYEKAKELVSTKLQ
jgi:hypothetical protein